MCILQSRRSTDFSKGVNPWFKLKILNLIFPCFSFKIDQKILFADVLDKKKVLPEYKNVHFTESRTSDFSKGLIHGLSWKIKIDLSLLLVK